MKRLLFLLVICLSLSGCKQAGPVKKTQPALGTVVEIMVADEDKSQRNINAAIGKAFSEIKRIEGLISKFDFQSDISWINARGCVEPAKVNPETINLIENSIKFSQLTDGAFDITARPLIELWGFEGTPGENMPTALELAETLEKVGYKNIKLNRQENVVSLTRPEMSLDLGAIGKGYAVDRAAAVLRQEGIKSALVNAGGDIYCLGRRSKTEKWEIAVRHPRKKEGVLALLELEDQAVATSGDYEKYFMIKGKRYSHIIDPRTGYPCASTPAGVTVLADSCFAADALATSILVLGGIKGIELVNHIEKTEAVAVDVDKGKSNIFFSKGFKKQ
jgi:thiamine biosynthesis lipoprotein